MKKLLAITAMFLTCAQSLQADSNKTADVPSGKQLVQKLSGKRIEVKPAPPGTYLEFKKGGILREENRGQPDTFGKWEIEERALCLEGSRPRKCFEVDRITDHELGLVLPARGDEKSTVWEVNFVNKKGVPLRDVISFDGKLARSLKGRTITTEEVNPPKSLKGSKTVWNFETRKRVSIEVFDASGFPFPGGTAEYNSIANDLCITPPKRKSACMRVDISGSDVRMTPLKDGVLLEEKAMIGFIE